MPLRFSLYPVVLKSALSVYGILTKAMPQNKKIQILFIKRFAVLIHWAYMIPPKYVKPKCGVRRISKSPFPQNGNEQDEGIYVSPEGGK